MYAGQGGGEARCDVLIVSRPPTVPRPRASMPHAFGRLTVAVARMSDSVEKVKGCRTALRLFTTMERHLLPL